MVLERRQLEAGRLGQLGELSRAVGGVSDSVLSDRLSDLAAGGLVTRTVDEGPPLSVSYALTDSGRALMPALEQIAQGAPAGRRMLRIGGVTSLTLLHNPHCPTSVHALDALEEAGHAVTVRKYLLKAERLSEDEVRSLAERIEGDPPDALIRRDKKYKELGLEADGIEIDEVVAILLDYPALLQRPILDDGTAVMIGRPRSRAAAWAAAGRVTE